MIPEMISESDSQRRYQPGSKRESKQIKQNVPVSAARALHHRGTIIFPFTDTKLFLDLHLRILPLSIWSSTRRSSFTLSLRHHHRNGAHRFPILLARRRRLPRSRSSGTSTATIMGRCLLIHICVFCGVISSRLRSCC